MHVDVVGADRIPGRRKAQANPARARNRRALEHEASTHCFTYEYAALQPGPDFHPRSSSKPEAYSASDLDDLVNGREAAEAIAPKAPKRVEGLGLDAVHPAQSERVDVKVRRCRTPHQSSCKRHIVQASFCCECGSGGDGALTFRACQEELPAIAPFAASLVQLYSQFLAPASTTASTLLLYFTVPGPRLHLLVIPTSRRCFDIHSGPTAYFDPLSKLSPSFEGSTLVNTDYSTT